MGTSRKRDEPPDRRPKKRRKSPAEPTQAEPGTAEKVRVLAERFRRRERLWHPDDRQRE